MSRKKENRLHKRYSLEFPVKLAIHKNNKQERLADHCTQNINAEGALIKTPHILPMGSNVDVTIEVPLERLKSLNSDKVNINISGQVIRVEKEGMVIGFDKDCHITHSPIKNAQHKPIPILKGITPREQEVLDLICLGFTNKKIAQDLDIGLSTVKAHIYNLYKKIKVSNRFQAILWKSEHM